MQIQSHQKRKHKIKKSLILLFGSLLVFIGVLSLSWNYLLKMKNEVFSDMLISITMSEFEKEDNNSNNIVEDVPIIDDITSVEEPTKPAPSPKPEIDYSRYLGVLEIPKIGLKRGFYNVDSRYNNIKYNVTLVRGSTLPDVTNGNLILMAHSGDAYISFFAYLYLLQVGDNAYVTYNNQKYTYQITKIYTVPKTGVVTISRNHDKTTLTLITCTKDSDTLQTVYIAELV